MFSFFTKIRFWLYHEMKVKKNKETVGRSKQKEIAKIPDCILLQFLNLYCKKNTYTIDCVSVFFDIVIVDLFPPQFCHIFQCFSFCFRNHLPDKDSRQDTHHPIQAIGKGHADGLQGRETGRYNKVGYPLGGNGNSNCFSTDGIREDLRDKYPADWSP